MQRSHAEKWPRPSGLALQCGHAALRIAYLEQPNRALRALPGHIGGPTLGIRIVLAGPDVNTHLVLASGSPRRQELLRQIGVEFDTHAVDTDESMRSGESVIIHVKRLALEKARTGYRLACAHVNDCVALGADTVVEIDGDVLGKPQDAGQAAAFLARLSARKHKVHTGVAVVTSSTEQIALSSSEVEFTKLSEQQINRYVKTGEPLDKAGAYAIQGVAGQFIVNLNGSYSGVMGLPLYETAELLAACGIRSAI